MKITKCTAYNVKGQTFEFALGAFTIIIGDHRQGKTARLDALRLGLIGFVPTIGKTNAETYRALGGEGTMYVILDTDCGKAERAWSRAGDSIKLKESINPMIPQTPLILLDSRSFFAMTPAAKTKWAFEHAKFDAAAFSPLALLARVKVLKADPHTVEHEVELATIVEDLADAAGIMKEAEITLQEWLTAEALAQEEQIKMAKGSVDRMEKLVAGMTQLEARHDVIAQTDISIAAMQAKRDELRAQCGQLLEQRGKNSSQLAAMQALIENRSTLTMRMAMSEEAQKALPEMERQIQIKTDVFNSYQSKRNALEATLQEVRKYEAGIDRDLENLSYEARELDRQETAFRTMEGRRQTLVDFIKALQAKDLDEGILATQQKINDITKLIASHVSKTHDLESRHAVTSADIDSCKAAAALRDASIDKMKQLSDGAVLNCPTCCRPWDDLTAIEAKITALVEERDAFFRKAEGCREVLGKIGKELAASKELDQAVTGRATELPNLHRELAAVRKTKQSLDDYRTELEGTIKVLSSNTVTVNREKLTRARAELEAKKPAARSAVFAAAEDVTQVVAADATNVRLGKEITALTGQIGDIKTSLAQLSDVRAKLDSMPSEKAIEDLNRIDTELTTALSDNSTATAAIFEQIEALVATKQDLLRKLQAVDERRQAQIRLEMRKLTLETIRAFQLEVLDGCFAPFLTSANRLALPMLKTPLVVQEGELGYRKGNQFVLFKSFSGLEQAITTMSVCFALADGAPCRIVLMDEMRAINDESKEALVPLLLQLVREGFIEQFVGTDTDAHPYIDPASLIELFPGDKQDSAPMGKPYEGITVVKI